MFSKRNWAISKLQNSYLMITKNGIIENKNEKYLTYQNWQLNQDTMQNENDIQLLKAIKQDYNSRMNNNNIYYEN